MSEPRFAFAYAEMAAVAEHVRKTRAEGDPALVEAGRFTADEAADRLRIATAVASDWRHFAEMELPPVEGATDREKIAMLETILSGARSRRDVALRAVESEYGATVANLPLSELWDIHEAHDPRSLRILPYLHWESYAAAIEAMLWWQMKPRDQGRRMVTMINIDMRSSRALQPRAAA